MEMMRRRRPINASQGQPREVVTKNVCFRLLSDCNIQVSNENGAPIMTEAYRKFLESPGAMTCLIEARFSKVVKVAIHRMAKSGTFDRTT